MTLLANLVRKLASSSAESPPADHRDLVIAEEEAVAGGAGGDAVAEETAFGLESEHARGRAGGDDHRIGRQLEIADRHVERTRGEIHRVGVGGDEPGPEARGLVPEAHHELRAHDSFNESGVVLDLGGEHQLTTGGEPFDDHGLEVGARGIDRGGEAGRARSDDDDFVVLRHQQLQIDGTRGTTRRR